MDEIQQGSFGPIFTQFKGRAKEAIRFLRQQQRGECIASLHRDDIGDIDIVWGEVTDPIKHRGLDCPILLTSMRLTSIGLDSK